MLKVGITGGIGSGKSLVCKIIESIGYPVFYSDDSAKLIIADDPNVRVALISRYGNEIYSENELNRVLLSSKIFENECERSFVNELIHPKVREAFNNFANFHTKSIVFNEAAILFETGSYKHFDRTILITAPQDIRIARVIKRDNCTKKSVLKRMNSQWTDEKKQVLAHSIIINDGTQALLIQIEQLIADLEKINQDSSTSS